MRNSSGQVVNVCCVSTAGLPRKGAFLAGEGLDMGLESETGFETGTCKDFHPLASSVPVYAELSFVNTGDFVPYRTKAVSANAIFCVYQNDVFLRFPKLRYRVVDVPGAYCTHLIYHSAGVTADGSIYSKDPTFDEAYQARIHILLLFRVEFTALACDSVFFSFVSRKFSTCNIRGRPMKKIQAKKKTGPTVQEVLRRLKHEVPREHRQRLCFSVSLKAQHWTLRSSGAFHLGSPARKAAPATGGSQAQGLVEYPLVCKYMLRDSLDAEGLCNYAVRFRDFVTYEGTKSLPVKLSRMRRDMGTPGLCLAVWDLAFDDFKGDCGMSRSPLLRAINKALSSRTKPWMAFRASADNG
ncbi:hypothetical protein V5799_013062 [Amblyomma americanum]|uniref:Uncharacterized protein n=1 Tax=Amblyomma americanum TaxID=6943 RepID=A0AAQ4E749_AMBAM